MRAGLIRTKASPWIDSLMAAVDATVAALEAFQLKRDRLRSVAHHSTIAAVIVHTTDRLSRDPIQLVEDTLGRPRDRETRRVRLYTYGRSTTRRCRAKGGRSRSSVSAWKPSRPGYRPKSTSTRRPPASWKASRPAASASGGRLGTLDFRGKRLALEALAVIVTVDRGAFPLDATIGDARIALPTS